jgi:hypothetical protein
VTGETPNGALRARRLTARPAESEQPGTEINYFQKQQSLRKKAYKKTHPVKNSVSFDFFM